MQNKFRPIFGTMILSFYTFLTGGGGGSWDWFSYNAILIVIYN